jgi:hypothetical protein
MTVPDAIRTFCLGAFKTNFNHEWDIENGYARNSRICDLMIFKQRIWRGPLCDRQQKRSFAADGLLPPGSAIRGADNDPPGVPEAGRWSGSGAKNTLLNSGRIVVMSNSGDGSEAHIDQLNQRVIRR